LNLSKIDDNVGTNVYFFVIVGSYTFYGMCNIREYRIFVFNNT